MDYWVETEWRRSYNAFRHRRGFIFLLLILLISANFINQCKEVRARSAIDSAYPTAKQQIVMNCATFRKNSSSTSLSTQKSHPIKFQVYPLPPTFWTSSQQLQPAIRLLKQTRAQTAAVHTQPRSFKPNQNEASTIENGQRISAQPRTSANKK